jgi:hypothetical protein
MKIAIIISLLLLCSIAKAQKTSFKGYKYVRTIRHDPEVEHYDSLGKKRFYIWRKQEVTVYPNPTSGMVYLSEHGDIEVSDITGRIIRKESNNDNINLYWLSAGTYLITIKTEENIYHHLEIKL